MGRVFVVVAMMMWASASSAADVQTARGYFQSGTKHFDLGEYEQALADFKEAYRIKDDPVLLYNIAQCHRMLHHNEEALRAYRTFLARSSDQSHRADVEQKIAALEEAVEKQNRASTLPPATVLPNRAESTPAEPAHVNEPPTPEPTPAATTTVVATRPERTPVYKKWWFWTAIGGVAVVGAGLGIGLGLGLQSHSSTNTFPAVSY